MAQPSDSRLTLQPTPQIVEHFKLAALITSDGTHKKTVVGLLQNGLYYMTVGNAVSALSSFSSAASYIYAIKNSMGAAPSPEYDTMLNVILGYVEKLQIEARSGSSSGSKGEGDKEDAGDLDVECETFGCEEDPEKNCLTFADVIGMKKEKSTFFSAIAYPLIYPNLYTKSAKGILLYGPPGTGKTFLIKAAVRELATAFPEVQVLFFPLTGADLKGKYVGETEKKIVRAYTCAARRACQMTDLYNDIHPSKCLKKIKDDFEKKRKATPDPKEAIKKHPQYVSVVFIDEFDAVGGDRSKDESGMTANAVNTMLQMMDGLQSFNNVITVCATNFPWNLDSALLRRFNEQVYCNVPSMEDIKSLVTKEQENRLKYFDENKRTYCSSSSMEKFYTASTEMKGAYSKANKAPSCVKGPKKGSIVDIIDKLYLKDKSPALTAAISEMAEKHYSNSDVASVMQKAFNIVSETALKSTLWQKVSMTEGDKDVMYWISRLTKLTGSTQGELDKAMGQIELSASTESRYKSPLGSATEDTNLIAIPQQIYIDSASMKSIFGGELRKNQYELKIANIVGSYEVFGGSAASGQPKFVNMKFINKLPTVLMLNDPTINEVFYNIKEVEALNAVLGQRKNGKESGSDTPVTVIFTRVLDIEYKGSLPSVDGLDVLSAEADKFLDIIDEYDRNDKTYAAEEMIKVAKNIDELNKKAYRYIKLFKDFIRQDPAIPKGNATIRVFNEHYVNLSYPDNEGMGGYTDPDNTPELGFYHMGPVVDAAAVAAAAKSTWWSRLRGGDTSAETSKYEIKKNQEGQNLYMALSVIASFKLTEKDKKVNAQLYWNNYFNITRPSDIEAQVKAKLVSEDAIKITNKDIVTYNLTAINFLDEIVVTLLKNSYTQESDIKNFGRKKNDYINYIIDGIKRVNNTDAGGTIFKKDDEASKTQKLFFFKSVIHPLKAEWVQYKASGAKPGTLDLRNLGDTFSKIKKSIVERFTGKSQLPEDIESTVAARIAESGISLSKYLLTRATHVGVLEIPDEKRVFIRTSDSTDDIFLDPEIVMRKEEVADAAAAAADGTTTPRPPEVSRSGSPPPGNPAGAAGGGSLIRLSYNSKKKTMKKSRGGAAPKKGLSTGNNTKKSQKARANLSTGEDQFKYIKWFKLDHAANTALLRQEGYNMSNIVGTTLLEGLAAGAGSYAVGAGLAALGLISAPVTLGFAGIFAAVTGATALVTQSTSGGNYALTSVERLVFNDMLGYFYSFKNPEENIYVVNMMFAEVFGGESLDIKTKMSADAPNFWETWLNTMFNENYEKALQKRERVYTQIREYAGLKHVEETESSKSYINIKRIKYDESAEALADKTRFLSFYMDASFISAAMKSYPSTYNPVTGSQLQDYNKNRSKFLEDYAAGKYDKKKA